MIAWLWVRTVKSPNPAFADVDVPLASTFMLSTKKGKEAYVEPVIEGRQYRFEVRIGRPADANAARLGTKSGGSGSPFLCLVSGSPIPFDYLRTEAKAGRMGARLMAMAVEGARSRVYLPPSRSQELAASQSRPEWAPNTALPAKALGFRVQEYGMRRWQDLFTPRQLVALTTFAGLVSEATERVRRDALEAGLSDDGKPLRDGGTGATAYAEAVAVYLALALDRLSDRGSSISSWDSTRDNVRNTFGRQAIPMMWDYAEANPLSSSTGSWIAMVEWVRKCVEAFPSIRSGVGVQAEAAKQTISSAKVVSTDPPYYDNIGYADLSDFFYVWLRRSLKPVFPELFSTLAVPKSEELVATPYRHGGKSAAESFFLNGMTDAMRQISRRAHPGFPAGLSHAKVSSDCGWIGGG